MAAREREKSPIIEIAEKEFAGDCRARAGRVQGRIARQGRRIGALG
jgi:hypothetical protein